MSNKITRFIDIPQLTRTGTNTTNVSWDYLEEYLELLDSPKGTLELDPDFQRHHVWDEEKQIRYVEYILRGGKSSRVLHFNCSTWIESGKAPIQLVDGKQRLQAVKRFINNEIPVFGSFRHEFTDKMRMTGPSFILSINDLPTRADILQWYIDLNDGGVAHTKNEIERVKTLLKEAKKE